MIDPRLGKERVPENINGKWYVELPSYGVELQTGDNHSLAEANRLFKGRTDLVCAEIGVAKGQGAYNINRILNPQLLILVDFWQVHPHSLEHHDNNWAETYYRIQDKPNIVVVKTTSVQASQILNLTFDYIYIDGDHTEPLIDIEAWWPKMNPGGIFGGHDYNYENIKEAVDQFFGKLSITVHSSLYHPYGGMDFWVFT